MTREYPGLPSSWIWVQLKDVANIQGGITLGKKRAPDERLRKVPYLRVANVQRAHLDLREVKLVPATESEIEALRLLPGDVLFNEGGDRDKLGRGWIWSGEVPECIHQNHVFRARLAGEVSPKFVSWYANTAGQTYFLGGGKQTTNLASVNKTTLSELPVPLAPIREQRRIVSKLEVVLANSRRAKDALDAIPPLLDQLRQSILAAAFRGDLTADWRAKNPDVEPASELLKRIRAERRRNWEETELAKMRAKRKVPEDDRWKARYVEPEAVDESQLPEVPEGWCWIYLDDILLSIDAGASFSCEERPSGEDEVGVVKVSAVTWGEYDEQESKTCIEPRRIDSNLFVRPGDFLFSRANTLALVGACVIARQVSRRVMLSDKILRLNFASVPSEWQLFMLRSPWGRSEIERLATGNQLSMRNIGQDRIRQLRVPLPPRDEMVAATEAIQACFDKGSALSRRLNETRESLDLLDQALLSKAFRGQLVPQDPGDEPASVLLERIRAKCVTTVSTGHRWRRGSRERQKA